MQQPVEDTFELKRGELLPGDILIVTDTRKQTNSFNKLTVVTQSTQVFFNQGHSEAVHAMIVARDETGALKIVEVSDDGVLLTDIKDRYRYNLFVYRPLNRVLAEQAGKVAYEGYQKHHQKKDTTAPEHADDLVKDAAANDDKRDEIKYSDGNLVHAVAFPILVLPHHFRSTHFSLKSICSKFVIQSFQIAQHQLIEQSPAMKRDIRKLFKKEKTSSVKSLENYVMKQKGFKQFIVPKEQETIYPTLVKVILVGEITKQKSHKKTAAKAKIAWDTYQQLTNHIDQHKLLTNPNYKPFDLALAVYAAVCAHLPDQSQLEILGYEFGFERHMLKDNRIMQLAATLREQSKGTAKPAAHNRDIDMSDSILDDWIVMSSFHK